MSPLIASNTLAPAWLALIPALPFLVLFLAKWRYSTAIAAVGTSIVTLLVGAPVSLSLPGFMLGSEFRIDGFTQALLLASSVIWLAAAIYHSSSTKHEADATRFRVFFLLAMGGNFALLVAGDAVLFFAGYALMGLSAAGLIAHRQSALNREATRIYLAFTVLGETLLFAGLAAAALNAGNLSPESLRTAASPAAAALLFSAFAIKLALPGLHLWIPLAYRSAPAAGSAVLSGAMMNAGVIGLLLFFPWDQGSLPASAGSALIAVGGIASLYGVIIGLTQSNPKVILAYSSQSQMGLVLIALGVGVHISAGGGAISEGGSLAMMAALVVSFTIHHGLTKSALFLLLDRLAAKPIWYLPFVVLALVLAGAPLTGGWWAKGQLKELIDSAMPMVAAGLGISTLATSLLMFRLLWLTRPNSSSAKQKSTLTKHSISIAANVALGIMILAVLSTPLLIPGEAELSITSAWTVALGLTIGLLAAYLKPADMRLSIGHIPAGDWMALVWRPLRKTIIRGKFLEKPGQINNAFIQSFASMQSRLTNLSDRTALVTISWATAGTFLLAMVLLGGMLVLIG